MRNEIFQKTWRNRGARGGVAVNSIYCNGATLAKKCATFFLDRGDAVALLTMVVPSLQPMSARTFERLFLILLLLALARHLWLSAYVHPYADDLSYATIGMRYGLLERLSLEYNFWNGRYFSNILVLRGPMFMGFERGLFWYRIVPIILMGLTWFGAYRLLRSLFHGVLSNGHARIGGLLFLLVCLNAMPDASEGFYWYTGAVSYQFSGALILILASEWITYLRSPERSKRPLRSVFMVLLVIVIAGCNELHMAILIIGHLTLMLIAKYTSGQWKLELLLFLILSLICGAIVALAPGNAVRGANFPTKHDVLQTGVWSIVQSGRFLAVWIFTTVLLPVSVVFIGWLRQTDSGNGETPRWFKTNKWLAASLPVIVVLVAMVLPYWSTGLLGQYRTVNAALLLFLPLWFVALTVWDLQVFRKRWSLRVDRRGAQAALLLVTPLFFVWGRDMSVTLDLLTGTAARYDRQMLERVDRIETAVANGEAGLYLPLVDQPRSLMINQPGPDPYHWMNMSLAEYFGNKDLLLTVEPSR